MNKYIKVEKNKQTLGLNLEKKKINEILTLIMITNFEKYLDEKTKNIISIIKNKNKEKTVKKAIEKHLKTKISEDFYFNLEIDENILKKYIEIITVIPKFMNFYIMIVLTQQKINIRQPYLTQSEGFLDINLIKRIILTKEKNLIILNKSETFLYTLIKSWEYINWEDNYITISYNAIITNLIKLFYTKNDYKTSKALTKEIIEYILQLKNIKKIKKKIKIKTNINKYI